MTEAEIGVMLLLEAAVVLLEGARSQNSQPRH
jgi:hypothetical protein